jgi:hypothetical protein
MLPETLSRVKRLDGELVLLDKLVGEEKISEYTNPPRPGSQMVTVSATDNGDG